MNNGLILSSLSSGPSSSYNEFTYRANRKNRKRKTNSKKICCRFSLSIKLREPFRGCERGHLTFSPGGRRRKVEFRRMLHQRLQLLFARTVGFICSFLFLLAVSFSAFEFHLRTQLNLAYSRENKSCWESVTG